MSDAQRCPRCTGEAESIATSPIAGAWTMYGCRVCRFSWRSTEDADAIDPERYPGAFKFDANRIGTMSDFPVIPPSFVRPGAGGRR